jgi:predicted CopG family antitoxin
MSLLKTWKTLLIKEDLKMGRKILTEVTHSRFKLVESKSLPQGVLAVARGVFAFFDKRNKNQRVYPKKAWQLTLASDYVVEALRGKRMFGELDHPQDYIDIRIDKTAFAVTDLYMDEANNTVNGELMVLDTPAGNILNTLIRFGSVLGVSSRATGELDSDNTVVPESYQFVTFDIVTNPSNEGAYPSLVESTQPVKPFNEVIDELIENATKDQLSIIQTVINSMDEELAAEYINKLEEKRKVLEESSDKEQSEVILDRLTSLEEHIMTVLANQSLILEKLENPQSRENDSEEGEPLPNETDEGDGLPEDPTPPEPVKETFKAKPKSQTALNESEETIRVVTRVSTKATDDDTQRRVEIIQAGKSK